MAESKQAAVRSFRVTDDVMVKFQGIRDELGLTQDAALAMLVGTYEMEQAKAAIPDRETEIANFQTKAQEMVEAYLHALQLNQDAEARIRAEVQLELATKDRAIADYQEQVRQLKAEKAALGESAALAEGLRAELDAANEQHRQSRNDYEDRLADKSRALKDADARMAMLEIKADGYDELKTDRDALAEQLRDSKQDIKDLKKDHKAELERVTREAEKTLADAVADAKAEGETKASELREQLQESKISAAQALQEAERQAHEADKVAAAEIRMLEQENARLREQLAELRAKMPKENMGG